MKLSANKLTLNTIRKTKLFNFLGSLIVYLRFLWFYFRRIMTYLGTIISEESGRTLEIKKKNRVGKGKATI